MAGQPGRRARPRPVGPVRSPPAPGLEAPEPRRGSCGGRGQNGRRAASAAGGAAQRGLLTSPSRSCAAAAAAASGPVVGGVPGPQRGLSPWDLGLDATGSCWFFVALGNFPSELQNVVKAEGPLESDYFSPGKPLLHTRCFSGAQRESEGGERSHVLVVVILCILD